MLKYVKMLKIDPPTNVWSLADICKLFQIAEVTFCHCK